MNLMTKMMNQIDVRPYMTAMSDISALDNATGIALPIE